MIIIEISGGLGNQMFQYALYLKMKHQHPDQKVLIDLSFFQSGQQLRSFELDLFQVQYDTAALTEVRRIRGYTYQDGILDKIRERFSGRSHSEYQENLDAGYQPEIFALEDVYLSGYWQCEKYFGDIRKELLECYTFPIAPPVCRKMLETIQASEAVAVHVRRGDYLSEQNARIYGDICTIQYYRKAIKYMRQHCGNPIFYFFTNDIPWVRENLYEPGMVIVTCNQGEQDSYDMYLMSQCRHNIIANSSFSWWGAWLNNNEEKIVVSPNKWFNNHNVSDAICDDWVRITG